MRPGGHPIFIDTSAIIAARDARDANHEAAIEYLREVKAQRRRFIVTNFVFAEVHAYFCRDHKVAITLGELLLNDPLFDYSRVTAPEEREAWGIARRYGDKGFPFVDCVSFAVTQRLEIQDAFAFDDHFRQFGTLTVHPE